MDDSVDGPSVNSSWSSHNTGGRDGREGSAGR